MGQERNLRSDQFQQDPLPIFQDDDSDSDSMDTARRRAVSENMRSTGRSSNDWDMSSHIRFGFPHERGADLSAPRTSPLPERAAQWMSLSTMPPGDIAEAGPKSTLQTADAEGLQRLGGVSAAYHAATHTVWVPDETFNVSPVAGSNILIHELGHALQNDDGDQRFVDEHKFISPEYKEALSRRGLSGDRVRVHGFEPSDFEEPQHASSINDYDVSLMPLYEGSAEGYRHRYAPMPETVKSYEPEHFENLSHDEDPHIGSKIFSGARSYTRDTGKVITKSGVEKNVLRLVGTLSEDLDESGGRSVGRDSAAASRMSANYVDRLQNEESDSSREASHEAERRKRHMAIYGQDIQGSLFPDITPETNQFGDEPIEIHRSPRGQAFHEGYKRDYKGPTGIERDPKDTFRYRLATTDHNAEDDEDY